MIIRLLKIKSFASAGDFIVYSLDFIAVLG
jgi:hypothetical protein